NRIRYLALGGFLNGLGMYDKANYIWYLAGMGLALVLIFRKDFFKHLTAKNVVVFLFFFAVGSFPLIQYNVATKGKTFQHQPLVTRDFWLMMYYKSLQLADTLNGTSVYPRVNYEPLNVGLWARENPYFKGNGLPLLLLLVTPVALLQRRDRWVKAL